jgi:hypothetical protein
MPQEYGGNRSRQPRELRDARGAQPRLRVDRRHRVGPQQPRLFAAREVGHRRAEVALLPEAGAPANGSAPTACRRPAAARTPRRSSVRRSATGTTGSSTGQAVDHDRQRGRAFIVFARTGEDRVKGISAFLVERQYPGVGSARRSASSASSASPTVEITARQRARAGRQPARRRRARLHDRARHARRRTPRHRVARRSASRRRARGDPRSSRRRSRIPRADPSAFQEAQWKLADIAADLDASRFLTWRAAMLRDAGLPCGPQAAMAKLKASKLANDAARSAVRILGAKAARGQHGRAAPARCAHHRDLRGRDRHPAPRRRA